MQRASFQFDGGRKSKKVMMKRGKEGSEGQKILRAKEDTEEEMTRHMTQSGVKKGEPEQKQKTCLTMALKLPITLDFLTSVVSFKRKIAHCDVTICGVTFHLG